MVNSFTSIIFSIGIRVSEQCRPWSDAALCGNWDCTVKIIPSLKRVHSPMLIIVNP